MSRPRSSSISASKQQSAQALPLHLALACLLVKLHPLNLDREPVYPYSATFTSAILHIVSREVFELSDRPIDYASLKRETDALLKRECKLLKAKNRNLNSKGLIIPQLQIEAEVYKSWIGAFASEFAEPASGCSYLDHLEHEMVFRISEKADEDMPDTQEPLEYKSPLGLFLRSLVISLRKLSFEDTAHISRQTAEWCGLQVSPINSRDVRLLDRITVQDERTSAIKEYHAAVASGDYARAISSLRRFYDHKFPATSKGQHAHGLLNLATFYYQTGGLEAARSAVEEAIRIARKDGDKTCLQHCMSLLHQLSDKPGPSTAGARRAVLSHLPKPATSNDELTMLLTALDLGEPLPQALQRIHLALAKHLGPMKLENASWTWQLPLDLAACHVIQARIWDEMGMRELAEVHEDLALESENGSTQRVSVAVSRAMRTASRGNFDDALSQLLASDLVDTLSYAEYTEWAQAIWELLHRQAELQDDEAAISLISSLRPSSEPTRRTVTSDLRAQIRKSMKLLDSAPPHIILPDILAAVNSAQQIGAWRLHRLATVIMADALMRLDKGLGQKVITLLEGIWDGVMCGDDEDVRALAALVLGKAEVEIAMEMEELNKTILDSAIKHLQQALSSAQKLHYRKVIDPANDILLMLADLYGTPQPVQTGDSNTLIPRIQRVSEIVKLVGVKVAQGNA